MKAKKQSAKCDLSSSKTEDGCLSQYVSAIPIQPRVRITNQFSVYIRILFLATVSSTNTHNAPSESMN